LLFIPATTPALLYRLCIGESSARQRCVSRAGIFTKIADIGSDLMNRLQIKEDDAATGVIADCNWRQRGDSVGPAPRLLTYAHWRPRSSFFFRRERSTVQFIARWIS